MLFAQLHPFAQAYDGHMNLILSDAEETIMIVDTESAPNGQSVVNVRAATFNSSACSLLELVELGCKTENGYAFCQRRWRYSCQ